MPSSAIRLYTLGERAAVIASPPPVNVGCQRRIWWLAQRLASHAAVCELVPGMNNLTVLLDPAGPAPDAFLAELEALWQQAEAAQLPDTREISLPVIYGGADGPDLGEVARLAHLSPDEVIALHAGANYQVYFLGFRPGFAYLGGLPTRLSTPRRAEPRRTVPAGSVGIGGEQTGVYPLASPGGWQVIGRCTEPLFDATAEPPTRLRPGDTVRFVPVTEPCSR
ncbi:5-oxoprolinase subunit PxpB [Neisseriaceae bacterium JH1-16]|nr:5-oxoprolinase subunit PxpB [Neisseriaceae bacterium JH1-16]